MVKKMDFYTDARYSTIVESRISEHELDLRIAQHDNTNDVNTIEGEPAECWLPSDCRQSGFETCIPEPLFF